jgi:para-aminobenzoate synthetase component 1
MGRRMFLTRRRRRRQLPRLSEIYSIRLDSSLADNRWTARPAAPIARLTCDSISQKTTLYGMGNEILRQWTDPLKALAWMASFQNISTPSARWIGYLSYDLGRLFERLPSTSGDPLALPLFCFTLHDQAGEPAAFQPAPARAVLSPPQSKFTRSDYENAVQRCIDYIAAGDVFQVNLSQRFSIAQPASAAQIYQRLIERTPAWYGALLQYPDHALICNSPETFLRVNHRADGSRVVSTRPIKGTRPRLPEMERILRDSIKDQAELNMIVDLERNDLGRVCEIGSVKVTQPRIIEVHPTVFHGAATIQGTLRPDVTFVDLLRATFPGGSVTGAPKIRAMEIIEELEPVRRGPYCGAIGYLSADGHLEFNIAIRTMIVKDGMVYIPVGGGIVADSTPAGEYEETLVKARAMFAALGVNADLIEQGG